MKKLYYFLLAIPCLMVLSFASCSNDDDDTLLPGENEPELEIGYANIKAEASKININVFEGTWIGRSFNYPDKDKYIYVEYDSVVMDIQDMSSHVYKKDRGGTIKVMQGYYMPGTHKTIVKCYAGGEIKKSDSISVNVHIKGDFLNVKWSDEAQTYHPSTSLNHNFYLELQYVKTNTPFALLRYTVAHHNTIEDIYRECAKGRKFFTDYMTALYKKPVYLYEGEDVAQTNLMEEYAKRFDNTSNISGIIGQPLPIAIWDTPEAHVAIIAHKRAENAVLYYIIAEPRK